MPIAGDFHLKWWFVGLGQVAYACIQLVTVRGHATASASDIIYDDRNHVCVESVESYKKMYENVFFLFRRA